MKRIILSIMLSLSVLTLYAQADRHEVRAGNRRFAKEKYREAEVEYRKSLLKDSLSVAGNYNLASTLYREKNYDEAAKLLDGVKESVAGSGHSADVNFNRGDVALQKKDYAAAVKAFRDALLTDPGDLDAKENYIYAKKMLENQQQQQQQQNQQNQQQQQNQDRQDQDQNQDNQNQDKQGEDQHDRQRPDQQQKISPQQAQQMLKAVQAQEQKTQDKVKKEKAAALQSRQKEKNW